jgi:GR25 family glycosyltransferase involved in LPS biosynthesis
MADIYCLSYNNFIGLKSMSDRFISLGFDDVYIYEGVGPEDIRISDHGLSSCMLGHMDLIYKFYHTSDKKFGIFCEDDIYIHKKLPELLPSIIENCASNNIELLLIGYLMPYHINGHHKLMFDFDNYKLYTYPDNLWGTQMYMISKNYAKHLLDNYGLDYALKWKQNPEKYTPYSADWIITKKTENSENRAILYPPLCIEDGENLEKHKEHHGQYNCHKLSHTLHVNEHFI